MSIRKMMVAIVALALAGSAMAAGVEKTSLKLAVGQAIKLGDVKVSLNQVVPPGKESLGGEGFTEYNLTITNTSRENELILSNAMISANGKLRPMVKDYDDIVNQGNSTEKNTAATAGAVAVGAIGGLFGAVGSLASMVGVTAAGNKIYVDDPQKWRDELKKKGLPFNGTGISVFPGETSTGSIWVKQAGNEQADRIQLYIKQGGVSHLVKLGLKALPPAKVAVKEQ